MRWQGSDKDRVTVDEAKAFFALVKVSFPERYGSMGEGR